MPKSRSPRKTFLSIGLKISLGLLLLLVIFSSILYLSYARIIKLNSTSNTLQNISTQTIEIYETNIKVLQLQNAVTVYSNTGRLSIFENTLNLYEQVEHSLSAIETTIDNRELLRILQNMKAIIERYGENLAVLQERYEFRNALINNSLPTLREAGFEKIKSFLSTSSDSMALISEAQLIESEWAKLNLDASLYLLNREFRLRKEIIERIDLLVENMNNLKKESRSSKSSFANAFELILNEFKSTIEKAIQANRVYRSLVNVVMAADAQEFSTLANLLEDKYVSLLEKSKMENQKEIEFLERIFLGSILLSLPIIFALFYFYNRSISMGIKSITRTFESYLKGDFSKPVPGIGRNDEIALLADAAQRFNMVSKELNRAKTQAERDAKTKSEFLANMSHEIRTPMNGILGMITLLKDSKLSVDQIDMLSVIESSGKSLLTILNDILDLSKFESGKLEFENILFNLNDVLNEIEHIFSNLAEDKNLKLMIDRVNNDKPFYLQGDVTRLKQVLFNLLSNAIKFTEEGSVTIKVGIQAEQSKYCQLRFAVTDTGIGIKDEDQSALFSAFTQADTSITRKYGGTGLGLSISSKIVEALGGNIRVKSKYGQGTTFEFSLQYRKGQPENQLPTINTSQSNQRSLSLLLVEDNHVNQLIATKMLEKSGHRVTKAENGKIAVEQCTKHHFDLIFMDMQMPVMDGIEATRAIRELANYQDIPIVAMTANVMLQDREKCFDAGMTDFLPKPISIDELASIISKVTA